MNAPEIQSDEQFLIQYLHERDVFCPLCKYNLRGLTTPRCPECGRELRLGVGLTEPFLRTWITLIVGVFGAAGCGLLLWVLILNIGWPDPRRIHQWAALIYFLASPILIWPAIAGRRRFLRLKETTQWLVAFGAAFVTLLAVLALARVIR